MNRKTANANTTSPNIIDVDVNIPNPIFYDNKPCLLYTSDAADE